MTLAPLAPPAGVPYARAIVGLEPGDFETIRRAVAALFRSAHAPAFEAHVDEGASAVARHRPANFAVFMGYDFHLTPAGPRLIEVNTNAGGALLNGLHTAALCDPARLACLCSELLPVETMEARILETFRSEHALARAGLALARVAIVDERPEAQPLRAEFALFRALFERAGVAAEICDPSDLAHEARSLTLRGAALDLAYLRDTDWQLAAPRSRALRAAYLAGDAVVTPSPREHHLLADKRRLALFSSLAALRALGARAEDAALLAEVVPDTRLLADLGGDAAWRARRDLVFKPAAAFGSRAVYRGDKLTRGKLAEILAAGDFVAQRRVDPGELDVPTPEGSQRMKFDVRAYAYQGEVLMLGARVYRGQVTNLRTPGGGFSAICVVRGDPAAG